MIRSMTGYGKSEAAYERGRITVEIRSVNHRYGEISVRLPRNLICLENDAKKIVADRLKRGKIEVYVQHETSLDNSPFAVNMSLAKAYYTAFNSLKDTLGLDDRVSLQLIATQKDVLAAHENSTLDESLPDALFAALRGSVENLDAMRLQEGETLLQDLRKRRETVGQVIGEVAKRAPLVVTDYEERLKERLDQICADRSIDGERLAQEVAIMADRCDITEELVRLDSHLKQFDTALALSEPVGRKLDFLLQEMSREINTIGSKANDAQIAFYVVELKTEIEKIREQVQNIE